MINITLDVVLGSPSMKYPKNEFKIINITQILKINPARGFCFIVHYTVSERKGSDIECCGDLSVKINHYP